MKSMVKRARYIPESYVAKKEQPLLFHDGNATIYKSPIHEENYIASYERNGSSIVGDAKTNIWDAVLDLENRIARMQRMGNTSLPPKRSIRKNSGRLEHDYQ